MTKPKSIQPPNTAPLQRLEQRKAALRRRDEEASSRYPEAEEAHRKMNQELMESLQVKLQASQNKSKRPKRPPGNGTGGIAGNQKKKVRKAAAPSNPTSVVNASLSAGISVSAGDVADLEFFTAALSPNDGQLQELDTKEIEKLLNDDAILAGCHAITDDAGQEPYFPPQDLFDVIPAQQTRGAGQEVQPQLEQNMSTYAGGPSWPTAGLQQVGTTMYTQPAAPPPPLYHQPAVYHRPPQQQPMTGEVRSSPAYSLHPGPPGYPTAGNYEPQPQMMAQQNYLSYQQRASHFTPAPQMTQTATAPGNNGSSFTLPAMETLWHHQPPGQQQYASTTTAADAIVPAPQPPYMQQHSIRSQYPFNTQAVYTSEAKPSVRMYPNDPHGSYYNPNQQPAQYDPGMMPHSGAVSSYMNPRPPMYHSQQAYHVPPAGVRGYCPTGQPQMRVHPKQENHCYPPD